MSGQAGLLLEEVLFLWEEEGEPLSTVPSSR